MKYAIEMDSGAMIHIQSFIKFNSAVQKLIGEILRQIGDCLSLLFFFEIKKVV
jgi:hypothetical protein